MYKKQYRPDRDGPYRPEYERNRKKILATENVCGICGQPVDKTLKAPNPMAPVIDHKVPINKGGHPSAMSNLQLAHAACNRKKSDKLVLTISGQNAATNRDLAWSRDWLKYRAK